jgi:hypothetical protein
MIVGTRGKSGTAGKAGASGTVMGINEPELNEGRVVD